MADKPIAPPSQAKPAQLDPAIRAAILRNRGGHEQADDASLRRLWELLDEETRARYLADVQEKGKKDDRPGSQSNV
jgi:hypothetical protein